MDIDVELKKLWRKIESLEEELDCTIDSVRETLEQIRNGMLGSIDGTNQGLVSRVRSLEADLERIKTSIQAVKEEDLKPLKAQSADTEKKKYAIYVLIVVGGWGIGKLVDWVIGHWK